MHATLSLTFLDPVTGIIAASIATPALLAMYFLRLRRRPVRISSTLLWDRAAQDLQVNAPFQWIKASWLLLVQLIILALLCLAVARPAIDRPTTQADRIALIIDCSASMRAADAGDAANPRTRFDAARDLARELIDRVPSSTEIMLIASSAEAVTVAPFTRDHGMLKSAIGDLEPVDQPGRLDAALALVAAAGTQGASEADAPTPLRAVIFSDAGYPSTESIPSAGRASVELVPVGPKPGGPRDNVGIVSIAAKRDFDDPTLVRLFLRVASWRDAPTTMTVRVDLDGVEAALQPVTIPARTDAGPGDTSVTIEVTAPTASLISATVPENDLLLADNSGGLRLSDASGPRVLIVQPAGPTMNSDQALVEAVEALDAVRITQMTGAQFNELAPSDPVFRTNDLVILDRVVPDRLPPIPTLSFGATIPIPGLAVTDSDATGDSIEFWDRTHPLLRYAQLDVVKITRPMHIELPDSGARTDSGVVRTQEIATGDSGPMIVVVDQGSIRRVVVAFALGQSNWWHYSAFPAFITNAVDYLGASNRAGVGQALSTTEPITFPAPPGAEAVISGPNGFERRASANSEGVARFGSIPDAGVFAVRIAGASAGAMQTNLLSMQESSLITGEELIVNGEPISGGSVDSVAPREIRDWLVALAILLLVLEWLLFASKMRI